MASPPAPIAASDLIRCAIAVDVACMRLMFLRAVWTMLPEPDQAP